LGREDPSLTISFFQELLNTEFWKVVENETNRADCDSVLVLVHGYNNSFESSILRAAQIGYDLKFGGMMSLFSWPSVGSMVFTGDIHKPWSYQQDEESVKRSVPFLKEYLLNLRTTCKNKKIHLVAHSMGSRLLLTALAQLKSEFPEIRFNNIIFAAADESWDSFTKQLQVSICDRTTVYATKYDKALEASSVIHHNDRMGNSTKKVEGVDLIDIVDLPDNLLSTFHTIFAESQLVAMDIYTVILYGTLASKRINIKQKEWYYELSGQIRMG